MIVIGIDPGITGAIALIKDGKFQAVWDMPTQAKGKPTRKRNKRTGLMVTRQKREINPWGLRDILKTSINSYGYHLLRYLFLEKVTGGAFGEDKAGQQRTQGVTSAFSFGDSYGVIRGVCAEFFTEDEFITVRPQDWKKFRGLNGQQKDVARLSARVWYPEAAKFLERKKDIGRADALMIADYGVSTCSQ